MKKIDFIVLSTLLFAAININAQQPRDTYSPTVFHPTPNVSNLNGFIDYPVDLSTGGVNISIPIYTIEQGDIKVPISIDYNVNNITVNGTSSNVGLGWSLNAGGAISRTTRGIADETSGIGFMNTQYELHYIHHTSQPLNDTEMGLLQQENRMNFLDFQADNFYYSGPFGGGKLAYDQVSNKFIQIPLSNKKLEYSVVSGMISEWLITDDNGTKYFYGLDEKSKEKMMFYQSYGTSIPENVNNPPHFTSWHLSKIEDNKGNSINFEYDYVPAVNSIPRIKSISQGPSVKAFNTRTNSVFSVYEHREIYLKKIIFNGGFIQFDLSAQNRLDLNNSKSLSEIKIYDDKNVIVKKFKLNQSYFESSSESNYYGVTTDRYGIPASNFTKRLKLENIEELALDNTNPKKYEFIYNSRNLPPKFATAQDYWGRFNCQTNTSLIPRYFLRGVPVGEANRSVNENCILASTLEKITFPTGATTEFLFEPNTASEFDYVHGTEVFSDKEEVFNLQINSANNCEYRPLMPNFTCEFTMPGTQDDTYNFILTNTNFSIDCPEDDGIPPGSNEFGGCNYIYLGMFDENDVKLTSAQDLEAGKTYKTRYNYAGRLPINQSTFYHTFKYSYRVKDLAGLVNFKVDGLRIKEVKTFDNNILSAKRIYNYEKEAGITSGYSYMPTFAIINSIFPAIFSTDVTAGVASTGVKYGKVKETILSTDNSNLIQEKFYDFYSVANEATYNMNAPILFPSGQEQSSGGSVHYSIGDNGFLKNNILETNFKKGPESVFKENNTYDIAYHNNLRYGFPAGMFCVSIPHNSQTNTSDFYSCVFHYNFTSYYRPLSKETTEKLGNSTIVNTTNYKYSNNNPFLVSETSSTSSLGETLRTEYYYPPDLTSYYEQSALMNKLVGRNQIASPVITKTFENGTATSEQRTHYAHFHENGNPEAGFILPQYVYAKKGEIGTTSLPADRKITYDYYDEKGNLTEYTLDSGIPVSIIWGYNKQYPIAKIEGLRNNQISSYITTLQTASNGGTLTEASFDALRTYTNGLTYHAIVTGYVYKPLVGVTAIVQPNGQTEHYQYDTFGRLQEVYIMENDTSGNPTVKRVLKKLEYNYKD